MLPVGFFRSTKARCGKPRSPPIRMPPCAIRKKGCLTFALCIMQVAVYTLDWSSAVFLVASLVSALSTFELLARGGKNDGDGGQIVGGANLESRKDL